MKIHPYLLARLYAIQTAFAQSGFQSPVAAATSPAKAISIPNWADILKGGDDKDGKGGDTSGGGGGTIKGLRGKNAEAAKAAMRRMTR
jgi:hypothetical protein